VTGADRHPLLGDRLPPLREVLRAHGIVTSKKLGQNFLLDLNLTRRIAASAGDLDGVNVAEIGAGPGGLTRALLETPARHVWAIERDPRCVAALADIAQIAGPRLTVVEADALQVDLPQLLPAPRRIVANLPYNIGTQLLLGWLADAASFERMTLMFQKEVADRLAAAPHSKSYGRLSVLAQWLCDVRPLFDVHPSAFVPPPAVTSTVFELVPLAAPRFPADRDMLENVTRHAFGQRRKMLRQALKPLGGEKLLARAGIEPTARAEELSVEAFCALANAVSSSGISPDATSGRSSTTRSDETVSGVRRAVSLPPSARSVRGRR
jgi:16S rRNA (adenine1518-N6/adenine1519-N6)-dimethyltransferase